MPTTPFDDRLLAQVTDPRLAQLARRGTVRSYRRQVVLMKEGELGDTLLVVLSGRLKAYAGAEPLDDGDPRADGAGKALTFTYFGPGDWVGEMALDGGPRSANVVTVVPSVCSVVNLMAVRSFMADEPEFAFDLLKRVIGRARQATLTSRNLVLTDAYGRLAALLTQYAGLAASPIKPQRTLTERFTQQEMAHLIGCSREMVSRLLRDLEAGGYISSNADKHWVLHRPLPPQW
jgi:CRP/FNR family cyclic AMP-dependent transcriptional regulator